MPLLRWTGRADVTDDALKVFAWEGDGVLTDYTNGLVVVIARSEAEAWAKLEAADDTAAASLRGELGDPAVSPICYAVGDAPVFLVHGGG